MAAPDGMALPLRGRWLRYALFLGASGAGTYLLLRASLWGTEPFARFEWFERERGDLFSAFWHAFVLIGVASAICWVGALEGGTRLVSRGGWQALAWCGWTFLVPTIACPLITPPAWLLWLVLGLAAVVRVAVRRRQIGDLLVIPVSVGLYLFWWVYFDEWWSLFGD